MRSRLLTTFLVAAFLLTSCNLKIQSPTTATSTPIEANQGQPVGTTPSPSNTPTLQQPSDTIQPVPTNTPTITLTPTLSTAMVTPKTEAANCRFGPGTATRLAAD